MGRRHISTSGFAATATDRAVFWPTVLSVVPLARCVVCLSVCLSVCRRLSVCLSVTFCIVAKLFVLAKKCLKEQIGNQGQIVDFLGRRRISTSGFAYMATKTAVFAVRSAKPCFAGLLVCVSILHHFQDIINYLPKFKEVT